MEIVEIICEFLEVVIHMVVFSRHLYPDQIFEKRRKYGIPVLQSIHPLVNEYISDCLIAAKALLQRNDLRQVIILFIDSNQKPVNRYVIDVLNINQEVVEDPFYIKLEQSFRAVCLSILTAESLLNPMKPNSRFSIQLVTSEVGASFLEDDKAYRNFPWYGADQVSTTEKKVEIVPLKTIDSDWVVMQLFVEKYT